MRTLERTLSWDFPSPPLLPHCAGKYPGQSDALLERLRGSGDLAHSHFIKKLSPLHYCICFHDSVLLFAKCDSTHCLCCFSVLKYVQVHSILGILQQILTHSASYMVVCICMCVFCKVGSGSASAGCVER